MIAQHQLPAIFKSSNFNWQKSPSKTAITYDLDAVLKSDFAQLHYVKHTFNIHNLEQLIQA